MKWAPKLLRPTLHVARAPPTASIQAAPEHASLRQRAGVASLELAGQAVVASQRFQLA